MDKLGQRIAALVLLVAISLGGVVWGAQGMTIDYRQPTSGAETVLTVDGEAVGADEYASYMYFLVMSSLASYRQTAMMFGMDGSQITVEGVGAEMDPYLAEMTRDQVANVHLVLQKMEENGLTVPYALRRDMKRAQDAEIESLGGAEAYRDLLAYNGFDEQGFANMNYFRACVSVLNDYYFGEDGAAVPSETELMQAFCDNYLAAKHILIVTTDAATGEQKRTDEQARAEAQAILDRIRAGEDFDALVAAYGEDPGMASQPNGYIFTEGDMVTEFYEGAKALDEGEVSELVKSPYGYHIIQRVPLDSKADWEQYRDVLIAKTAGTITDLMETWAADADVQTTALYDTISYQNMRDYLPAEVQARLDAMDAAAQAEQDAQDTPDGQTETAE
ncbi:MAG: peptidylprolyl isomerase [Eubacteriales bacterium]|nr:peptidylprolyl isomerase [Eubacteriales bacterium]